MGKCPHFSEEENVLIEIMQNHSITVYEEGEQ